MYSDYTSPPFLSMAADIHGQPMYGNFVNIGMDSHEMMDIDSWISEMDFQSDMAKSYSSSGQPPSIGDVRPMVVSEASGSYHMYSDGQPPSVNDVGRREPSQSEPSCSRFNYEGPDAHEVQQQPRITEIGVEKNRIDLELWQSSAGPSVNLRPQRYRKLKQVNNGKLGDRVSALHQLVSPFGRTDKASVLFEATAHIRFLESQIEALSSPYMNLDGSDSTRHQYFADGNAPQTNLKSKGLCLVPVSSIDPIDTTDNCAEFWTPAFGVV